MIFVPVGASWEILGQETYGMFWESSRLEHLLKHEQNTLTSMRIFEEYGANSHIR